MSNHAIGHAMSYLGEDIIALYEAGKISKEAFRSIILSYTNVACDYDGNAYEATESVEEAGYCGLCLTKHENLSDGYDIVEEIKTGGYGDVGRIYERELFRDFMESAVHYRFCPECKAKIISNYLKKKNLS